MVAVYKIAIANGWTTKAQQHEWVLYRDAVCTGDRAVECVFQVTNERIVALGG
jgi:hypothetical protein